MGKVWESVKEYWTPNYTQPEQVREVSTPPAIPSRIPATYSLDNLIGLSAVNAALRVIYVSVSQLELGVYRNGEELPTPKLVSQPDVDETGAQFLKRTALSLATSGNAYWRLTRDGRGAVANVRVLNPLSMRPAVENGRKVYHYAGDDYLASQTFSASQIQHLRLLEIPGRIDGLGPIQACRASLAGALDQQSYASEFFTKSGVPSGTLSTDQELTAEEADAYRTAWHASQAVRQTAVLGKGLSYDPILLSPKDTLFIETQRFSVQDVARMFGVPVSQLAVGVDGTSMTYTNIEQANLDFIRFGLMPYLMEIEQALTALVPRGQTVKFRVDGLLRSDAKTRSEINSTYHGLGVLTTNEIRQSEGLKPLAEPVQTEVAA